MKDDPMTYYESAEGQTISAKRAWQEFDKQGLSRDDLEGVEFKAWLGDRATVCAQAVLGWLGY